MDRKTNKIVSLPGKAKNRKHEPPSQKESVLFVDGERMDLESFILSGSTVEGKRVLLTWNTSLDELLSYNAVLNVLVDDKVRDSVSTD